MIYFIMLIVSDSLTEVSEVYVFFLLRSEANKDLVAHFFRVQTSRSVIPNAGKGHRMIR